MDEDLAEVLRQVEQIKYFRDVDEINLLLISGDYLRDEFDTVNFKIGKRMVHILLKLFEMLGIKFARAPSDNQNIRIWVRKEN